VVLEAGQVSFLFGDRRLTTKLIEGTFPNYRALLPDAHETSVVVERAALVEALQRVAVVAMGQANTPVTLTFGTGRSTCRPATRRSATPPRRCPPRSTARGSRSRSTRTFLLAGLEATGTERIRIELRDGLKPAVLRRTRRDDDEVPTT
jgi:DNA polymerase III subunit beta